MNYHFPYFYFKSEAFLILAFIPLYVTKKVIAASLGDVEDKEVIILQLRGQLLDGTEISGEDVVIIRKGKEK